MSTSLPAMRASARVDTLSQTCTQLRLVQLSGAGAGRKYLVRGGEVIGRGEEADVTIDDPTVSRLHARIHRGRDGRFRITDLKSRNGTAVNGVGVSELELEIGDRIHLGSDVVVLATRYDPSEQQLLQQQRLEVLGRIGASLAHDLKNMQAVILAGLNYIQHSPSGTQVDDEDIHSCLDDVRTASARATELIARLLSFTRSDDEPYALLDVASLCRETLRLASIAFGRSIEVKTALDGTAFVSGSTIELHQVLMNICMNARDAMPDGGMFTASLEAHDDHVIITLADTGHGMDEATLRRVFEPFFTTKRNGNGFGLGLATVRDLVAAHGGTVTVESAPGKGTSFSIRLPTAPPPERQQSLTQASVRRAVGGVVLVVDPDATVQRTLCRVLTRAGYEALGVADGVAAIERFNGIRRQRPDQPRLLVVDALCPKLPAAELMELVKERQPSVGFVVLSDGAFAGADAVIGKRAGAAQLLGAVAQLMDQVHEVAISDWPTVDSLAPHSR